MDAANLARWTRFAAKGGIGRCVAVQDCVAESAEDLMFLKGDEIVVLVQLNEEGRFLGYCEGVVGQFSAADVQFTTKLKKAVFAKRPGSSSSSSLGHANAPTPIPSSPGARGSILATPEPHHTADLPIALPPASSIVHPPPSMFSPPSRNAELPPSGRATPASGRSSPAAGLAARLANSASNSGRNSPATRILSPPPSAQRMTFGAAATGSGRASPSSTRILSPPARIQELPKRQQHRADESFTSEDDDTLVSFPAPPTTIPHNRSASQSTVNTHHTSMSTHSISMPFPTSTLKDVPPQRSPPAHQYTNSTSSPRLQPQHSASPPQAAYANSPPHANSSPRLQQRQSPAAPPRPPRSHSRTPSVSGSTSSSRAPSVASVYSQPGSSGSPAPLPQALPPVGNAAHTRADSLAPAFQLQPRNESFANPNHARTDSAAPSAYPRNDSFSQVHGRNGSMAPSVYSQHTRNESAYSHARTESSAFSQYSGASTPAQQREREARELELDIASALAALGGPKDTQSFSPADVITPVPAGARHFHADSVSSVAQSQRTYDSPIHNHDSASLMPKHSRLAERGSVSTVGSTYNSTTRDDSDSEDDPFALDRHHKPGLAPVLEDAPRSGATFGGDGGEFEEQQRRREEEEERQREKEQEKAKDAIDNLGGGGYLGTSVGLVRSDTITSTASGRSGEWGIGVSLLQGGVDSSDEDDQPMVHLQKEQPRHSTPPPPVAAAPMQVPPSPSESGGDGEEWDGDSIYDGYRYSRASMYSRRASRFTALSNFGSPEMPQRARGALTDSPSAQRVMSPEQRMGSPAQRVLSPEQRVMSPEQIQRVMSPEQMQQHVASPSHRALAAAGIDAVDSPAQRFASPATTATSTPTGAKTGSTATPTTSTANGGWTPAPVLPLSPTRKGNFASQQGQIKRDDLQPQTLHRGDKSVDASSVLSVSMSLSDNAPGGLDMLAEAHKDDEPLLSHGTFAGSPPMSATSSTFDHQSHGMTSPRAFVFPLPRKQHPPQSIDVMRDREFVPGPLSASPEPILEPPNPPRRGPGTESPNFPLMSATALRARFEEERRREKSDDREGARSEDSAYDDADQQQQRMSGMRVVTEDGPGVSTPNSRSSSSPADQILPRKGRPSVQQFVPPVEQAPPRAPMQASFGEDQLARRSGPPLASPDFEAEVTPRAPVVASFAHEQLATPPPGSLGSPDTPSPSSATPRPFGPGMTNGSGRNSPAPANFLPHPNAPVARAGARLMPGTGVGSAAPFNMQPIHPYAPPPPGDQTLRESLAMAAGRRGMTIKGRMEMDLSSATSPVRVMWSVAVEGDPDLNIEEPHSPASPARARQQQAKAPHVHPLANSYSSVDMGAGQSFSARTPDKTRPPQAPWSPAEARSQSPAAAAAAPGGGGLMPPGMGPISRGGQFTPRVGGQRPRSRSFSGFTGNVGKDAMASPDGPGPRASDDNTRQPPGFRPSPQQQQRMPQRVPSVPVLAPSPLSIPPPGGPGSRSSPSSPMARIPPSPLSPMGNRKFPTSEDSPRSSQVSIPPSPLSATGPRRGTGLRHAASAMNISSSAAGRPQSPATMSITQRVRRSSGSAAEDHDGSQSGHDTTQSSGFQASPEGGSGRPSRSLSLRSKISLSALRARSAAADAQRSDVEETVNVQDMEFELVRPSVPAARSDAEGRPSGESRESLRSGRESVRSDSPELQSSMAHEPIGLRGAVGASGPSAGSLEAYRAREQKWMTLIGTTQHKSKKVRKLVLEGVPASVRSRVWAFLTDSKSRRTPGVFAQLNSKGNPKLTEQIDTDVQKFFGDEPHLSEPKGKGTVVNILQAYFVMVADVRYQADLAIIAGNLALQCPEEEAFWTLVQLMESHLRGYFAVIPVQLDVDAALFAKALDVADSALSLRLFADLRVSPPELCQAWFLSLFARTLPIDILHRVWDIFLFDGPAFLFRVGLAILHLVRRQLFSMQGASAASVIAFLSRPPAQAFPQDPEAFIQLCFTMRLKEDDIRKARIKNAEQLLKERMQSRFTPRAGRR